MHTFACPVFALQNALASGNTLPRWSPRAYLGLNLGPSPIHSRNVYLYLVLNLTTGCVSHLSIIVSLWGIMCLTPSVGGSSRACIMLVESCPTLSWRLRQLLLCSMRPPWRILLIIQTSSHSPKLTLVPLTAMIVSLPIRLLTLKHPVQLLHPAQGQQGLLHHLMPLRELLPPTLM